ncbi:response regulator transcription factor [Sphingomonas glaciei]|uniref:Response regulator n=1 Tax=Sphingomonas glaciei TaxID=2938948 RepID=A0ABY5MV54_9SPHN|nr:response regulator [Sphingomonas glaciei]UUR08365.1 response regulator [Sphingomonas glaciei]
MDKDLDAQPGRGLVYVVDDDADLRTELCELLCNNRFEALPFGDGAQFLDAIRPGDPSCVLLDVRMPGVDGITAQTRLRAKAPLAAVIMLSGHGDIPIAVQATKAGAIDFIEKPVAAGALLCSIDDALATARARQSDLEPTGEARRLVATLSHREYQVLRGMVGGLQNKVIAYRLSLSQRTVEIYRAKAMKKLRARSLPLAVQTALVAGVPPLDSGDGTPADACLYLSA